MFTARLVGPTTWRWVAAALTSAGHDVTVPDLRAAAMTGQPQTVITAALAPTATDPVVLVGHSGAGFFLPSIADHLESPPRGIVFVDAGIPPCEGQATASADFLDRLRSLSVDGMLPRWSTWWGEGVMEMLVPSGRRRAEIAADMPRDPAGLLRVAHQSPGWLVRRARCLPPAERGVPPGCEQSKVARFADYRRLGNHLDIVNDPDTIAHDLVDLVH